MRAEAGEATVLAGERGCDDKRRASAAVAASGGRAAASGAGEVGDAGGATGRAAVGEQMGERRPAAREGERGHRRDDGGRRGGVRHHGELARRDRADGGGRADGGEKASGGGVGEWPPVLSKAKTAMRRMLPKKCYLLGLQKLTLILDHNHEALARLASCLLNSSPNLKDLEIMPVCATVPA
uniref:Uncharacterized protein n=1 Tax=Oryza nivara TaxID=4536 RepID=A0A0E0FS78_ORYNI